MDKGISGSLKKFRDEWEAHLTQGLLPFWLSRAIDTQNGGVITHFDRQGKDTGTDEKSLIAQSRFTYAMAATARAGYERERCTEAAAHSYRYLTEKMWDSEHGGFYWMTDRSGKVTIDRKIAYGQSFAVYALAEYYLAFGMEKALDYARRTFSLLNLHGADLAHGGFYEMFGRDWTLSSPGSAGGDRKTLDVHMHLVESFTSLLEADRADVNRRRLHEVIDLLTGRFYPASEGIGIPQYFPDWKRAPQIRFDIIWGWDRFAETGMKPQALDNGSYGHDLEFFWLLLRALRMLGQPLDARMPLFRRILDHFLKYGLDREYGGVYVEGPAEGPASDLQKEFWQQSEAVTALLDAYILFGGERFLDAYALVHRFIFDRMITPDMGEWLPLLERDGTPVWTHMGTSWKICYHTIRSALMCIERLNHLLGQGAPAREGRI